MLDGLPDRPLKDGELTALVDSDAIDLVFPATPDSMREAGEEHEYHDLLVFVGETVAGVSYDGEKGWIVAARGEGEEAYETALDGDLEHREYDLDREEALEEVIKRIAGITDVLDE